MKKYTWFALPLGLAMSPLTQASIIISEVVEGSGYNKAIELANVGNESITLNGYKLQRDANFGGNWAYDYLLDDVTLAPNQTYVIGHSSAVDDMKALFDDTNSNAVNFNGDDPIRLVKDDQVVDMVGPDSSVTAKIEFNKDVTLVRRVYQASPEWNENQWQVLPKDDWSNLGILNAEGEESVPEEPVIPDSTVKSIMEIQGNGDYSPFTDPSNNQYESDDYFEVTGVITHIQNQALDNDLLVGFFMQDPQGDNDPLTSDGIFVNYSGNNASLSELNIGDSVTVIGKAYEHYHWTQLNAVHVKSNDDTGIEITPQVVTSLAADDSFAQTLERYEGMLVHINQDSDMRVARTFGFDYSAYRNNMVLTHKQLNYHPNQLHTPNSEQALATNVENEDRRLFVESTVKANDGEVPWYPEFGQDNGTGTTDHYIRVNAQVAGDGLVGVLGYSYSEYRLYVLNQAMQQTFDHQENPRPAALTMLDGDLKLASFNVENFFNSEFGGRANPLNQNRGAESIVEFERQLAKIVTTLTTIDADIIGLIELENNGFDEQSALHVLVEALNQNFDEENQYSIAMPNDLADDGYVGTDAITNKIIFRANKATLDGVIVIDMPQQHVVNDDGSTQSAYQRDALTASFIVEGSDQPLVVSAHHFKSKGSGCWEDSQEATSDPDLQGSCENFRVSAAYYLGEQLEKLDGHKIIMGDLNSYGLEDPMLVLTNREQAPADYTITAARNTYIGGDHSNGQQLHGDDGYVIDKSYGYVDIVEHLAPHSYSYSYNDTVGTLDYVLVNDALKPFVVDAMVWPINAVESTLFGYSAEHSGDLAKYNDMYRTSDHDPAVIVLKFTNDDDNNSGDSDSDSDSDIGDSESENSISAGSSTGTLLFALLLVLFSRRTMLALRK